jgi:hypothetical protein
VEKIIDSHLGLRVVFETLQDPVIGGLDPDARKIAVTPALDPSVHPEQIGRYRFTLAHEIGHWELHAFLPSRPFAASCQERSTESGERAANFFAACLLMPRGMMLAEWKNHQSTFGQDARRQMARRFDVSDGAMAMRLAKLDLMRALWGARRGWPFERTIR